MLCLFCNVCLDNDAKFLIDTCTTSRGSVLLDVLDKIVDTKVKYLTASLCSICCSLLEEFDIADATCNRIRSKIIKFLGAPDKFNVISKSVYSQTQGESEKNDGIVDNGQNNNESDIINYLSVKLEEENTIQTCTICNKSFCNKIDFQRHCKTHRKAKSISFGNATLLLNDEQLETVVKEENFHGTADTVDESKLLRTCVEIIHNGETSIEERKYPIKRKSEKRGRKKKPLDTLTPYQCPQCPKQWKTSGELKNHISSHSQIRPYICEVCGQAYKQKAALDVHIGMHNGINPFSCPYCNKAFTQKGALQRHIPIHTGEAPYQCDLCGKRFVHHTSFNMHQLTHTGQKDYKCEICGLALLSGSHLKRHMRVHTGERPYACLQCGKRFAERYNLMAHQRLHEAGNSTREVKRNHRCQICGQSFERRLKLEEHLTNEHHKIGESDEAKEWMGNFLAGADSFWSPKHSLIKNEAILNVEVEYHPE